MWSISHVSAANVVAEASAEAAHIISAISEVPSVPAPGTSDDTAHEPPVPAPPAGQHRTTHTAITADLASVFACKTSIRSACA